MITATAAAYPSVDSRGLSKDGGDSYYDDCVMRSTVTMLWKGRYRAHSHHIMLWMGRYRAHSHHRRIAILID